MSGITFGDRTLGVSYSGQRSQEPQDTEVVFGMGSRALQNGASRPPASQAASIIANRMTTNNQGFNQRQLDRTLRANENQFKLLEETKNKIHQDFSNKMKNLNDKMHRLFQGLLSNLKIDSSESIDSQREKVDSLGFMWSEMTKHYISVKDQLISKLDSQIAQIQSAQASSIRGILDIQQRQATAFAAQIKLLQNAESQHLNIWSEVQKVQMQREKQKLEHMLAMTEIGASHNQHLAGTALEEYRLDLERETKGLEAWVAFQKTQKEEETKGESNRLNYAQATEQARLTAQTESEKSQNQVKIENKKSNDAYWSALAQAQAKVHEAAIKADEGIIEGITTGLFGLAGKVVDASFAEKGGSSTLVHSK